MLRWILYIFFAGAQPTVSGFRSARAIKIHAGVHTLQVRVAPYKGSLELLHIIRSKSMPGLEMFGRAGLNVYRPVLGCDSSAGRCLVYM